MINIKMLVHK